MGILGKAVKAVVKKAIPTAKRSNVLKRSAGFRSLDDISKLSKRASTASSKSSVTSSQSKNLLKSSQNVSRAPSGSSKVGVRPKLKSQPAPSRTQSMTDLPSARVGRNVSSSVDDIASTSGPVMTPFGLAPPPRPQNFRTSSRRLVPAYQPPPPPPPGALQSTQPLASSRSLNTGVVSAAPAQSTARVQSAVTTPAQFSAAAPASAAAATTINTGRLANVASNAMNRGREFISNRFPNLIKRSTNQRAGVGRSRRLSSAQSSNSLEAAGSRRASTATTAADNAGDMTRDQIKRKRRRKWAGSTAKYGLAGTYVAGELADNGGSVVGGDGGGGGGVGEAGANVNINQYNIDPGYQVLPAYGI